MDALKTRLTEVVGQFFSQSPLAEAINYTLNHWDGVTLFLTDGRVEVDSNTVERSMRPIALGRNYAKCGLCAVLCQISCGPTISKAADCA